MILLKVLKVKDKEKEKKKEQLKNLSDESREIEDLLKQHKLGSALLRFDRCCI